MHNIKTVQVATELFPLKWLILYYVNFVSILKKLKKKKGGDLQRLKNSTKFLEAATVQTKEVRAKNTHKGTSPKEEKT